jgi:small ligand-binding sensory domain FIST
VPFASALSEHPVPALATGETAGAILEAIGERPDLVVVTTTRTHAGALEDIVRTVDAVLHPLAMTGCASGSVLAAGHQSGETPAIVLWAGQVGPLTQVRLQATRRSDDTWVFTGWPQAVPFAPRALVLMADPFTFPVGEFLAWLRRRQPGLPVIGGNTSGGRGPGGARLVVGTGVVTSGAVGVLIGGGVEIEPVVAQGCRAYGRPLTVTRSERNLIHEIAGRPALECLADQMRNGLDPIDIATTGSGDLLLGRLIDDHLDHPGPGDYLVRTVVGADRSTGAVAVEDRVPVGSTVRFHHRDTGAARAELLTLLHGRHADAALMFTGATRGTRLFEGGPSDAGMLIRSLGPIPVSGFLSAGEFGPIGGYNFVHDSTASMALLRDR